MPAISLRLPGDQERRLGEESRHCGQPRSEPIREALKGLLRRQDQQRLVAGWSPPLRHWRAMPGPAWKASIWPPKQLLHHWPDTRAAGQSEVGAFVWTVPALDIVNPGREEQCSVSVWTSSGVLPPREL